MTAGRQLVTRRASIAIATALIVAATGTWWYLAGGNTRSAAPDEPPVLIAPTHVIDSVSRAASEHKASSVELAPATFKVRRANQHDNVTDLRSPEGLQFAREILSRQLQARYQDLAVALDLPRERANQLLDLLVEQRVSTVKSGESELASMMIGEDNSNPAVFVLAGPATTLERQRRERAEIEQLLGVGGLEKWDTYQDTVEARRTAGHFATQLAGAGEALSDEQRRKLITVLTKVEQEARLEAQGAPAPPFESMTGRERLAWVESLEPAAALKQEQLRQAVTGILSPAQMKEFSASQERENSVRKKKLRELEFMAQQGEFN